MENSTQPKGRPAHSPSATTRRFVEAMAGAGVPQSEIAAVLAIAVPTLRKYYVIELRRGSAVVQAKLACHLFDIAMNGKDAAALQAIIFSLQTRFGWSKYAPPPPR